MLVLSGCVRLSSTEFVGVHLDLPDHLMKKYNIIDPKKPREYPDLHPDVMIPKKHDTSRTKTEGDIPRVPEEDMHVETISDDEWHRDEWHDYDALKMHNYHYNVDKNAEKVDAAKSKEQIQNELFLREGETPTPEQL